MNRRARRRDKKFTNSFSKETRVDNLITDGLSLYEAGDQNGAKSALLEAFAINPSHSKVGNILGVVLHQLGQLDKAIDVLKRYLINNEKNGQAWLNLGLIYREHGRLKDALAALNQAKALLPDEVTVLFNRSAMLIELKRFKESIVDLKRCAHLAPASGDVWSRLAHALTKDKDFDSSITAYRKAVQLLPQDFALWNRYGFALSVKGDQKGAMDCYLKAVDLNPAFPGVYLNIAKAGELKKGDHLFENAIAIAKSSNVDVLDRASILFALGLSLDFGRFFDEAFEQFEKANSLMRGMIDYNETVELQNMDSIISSFKKNPPILANDSHAPDRPPIFVLGMPRSGTSLVEQILASHKDVFGAGEVGEIAKIAAQLNYPHNFYDLSKSAILHSRQHYLNYMRNDAKAALYYVDKEPRNFLFIGLIFLLFPGAKIVHCQRNPLDTCLSCYMQQFNAGVAFSFSLKEIGRYFKKYSELMAVWDSQFPKQIFQLHYEDLIADVNEKTKQIAEYCELSWDPSMLEFHKNERAVFTASKDQVRRPIYTSSIGRWKEYQKHLSPLIQELEGPLSF